jgi:hypothetical protein
MNSEYNTSYNTKAENTTLNHAVVHVAAALANRTKTPDQIKTTVLTKMSNSINKTIPYPLVMCASYIAGNNDSWCPMKFEKHDFRQFQRGVLNQPSTYDDATEAHTFTANDEQDDTAPLGTIRAMDAVAWYTHRNAALYNWSPVEVTMGFKCDVWDATEASKEFKLTSPFMNKSHKPRFNRAKEPVPVIPQGFAEHPIKPASDASSELKESFAAWALGNFYSVPKINLLDGNTLWDKYHFWRANPQRGAKDKFAFCYIDNIQNRLEARALMTGNNSKYRVFQRQVRATVDPSGNPDNHGNNAPDERVRSWHDV